MFTLLGHVVNANKICPMESKVSDVVDFSCPSSQQQLRKFLGMINIYHHFIPHCAQVLQPLHTLLTRTHAKLEFSSQSAMFLPLMLLKRP